MMNFSVEHIGLPAADTVALRDWYVRVLGARELFDNGQTPPAFFLALGGGAWLEIYPADATPNPLRSDNGVAGFRHIALRVNSLEAAMRDLNGKGVQFSTEIRPAGGGGKVVFFRDCEGNLLHLVERPLDSLLT